MPTYEYRCKHCDHRFDIVQSFSDDALTTCPECGEAALKKVFGNVGIAFKGSGFYKTDSRSGSSSSSTTTSGSDTASSSTSSPERSGSTAKADASSSSSSSSSGSGTSTSTASS